jgi:hypothetical protein
MNDKLTLKLDYSQLVELGDLSLALLAFGNEFSRFSNTSEYGVPQSKLYLSSVERGSVVAELVAIASQASLLVEHVNSVNEFLGSAKAVFDYFLGKSDNKPKMDKRQLENINALMEPVAKDKKSMWSFSAEGDGNSFTINYYESCVIQNGIKRELLQQPVAGEHHQVVLIFKQTRSDPDVGTKSVIESISKNIVKTVFAEGADYNQILLGDDNPLTGMYLVDVRVETVDDKPVLYKILRLHDRI